MSITFNYFRDLQYPQVIFEPFSLSPYEAALNRYEKAKGIHSIVKHTAERLNFTEDSQLESLMKRAVWFFDKKYNKEKDPIKASYHIFRKAVDDESVLDEADLNEAERKELLRNIKLKMMPTPDKIRADVSVHCTGPAGVEAVKAALKAGIESAGKKSDRGDLKHNEVETDTINITLIAPPEYRKCQNEIRTNIRHYLR